jgi:hypothetical protein
MIKLVWVIIFAIFTGFVSTVSRMEGYAKGFEAGKIEGRAEVQTPAYIVRACSSFWFGSEREGKKMIDRYCKGQK